MYMLQIESSNGFQKTGYKYIVAVALIFFVLIEKKLLDKCFLHSIKKSLL